MNCENIFCIYWENEQCSLNNISLDINGTCIDCIYVKLNDYTLEKIRKTERKRLNNPN